MRCQRVGPTIPDSVGCVISDDADQASVAVPSMKMAVRVLSQAAPRKREVTGAIYDLQAPSTSTQVQIGDWNKYEIEANGSRIRVTLNGQLVNDYQSPRQGIRI